MTMDYHFLRFRQLNSSIPASIIPPGVGSHFLEQVAYLRTAAKIAQRTSFGTNSG